ncbi:hypothetical protein RRG08_033680 [Elysia crispata]|uniref:Uncharacterized protein n=1 Tax=Elysia crispata TaxID=231223 RepID=A0AAE1DUI1_9GAST|nr:hypothetical protein RRG08_033680 [Elysia crispata]
MLRRKKKPYFNTVLKFNRMHPKSRLMERQITVRSSGCASPPPVFPRRCLLSPRQSAAALLGRVMFQIWKFQCWE